MRVNRAQLAEILGISKPTVTAWLDDGLPYTRQGSKGVEWEFETREVIEWYAASKFQNRDGRAKTPRQKAADPFNEDMIETEDEAKARKERALADKHELDAAERAGQLVPIDEVKAIVVDEHSRVRSRLLAIPNAVRPIALTHLNNDRPASEKLVSAVESAIVDALTEVSSYLGESADHDVG
jgi:phage terminase Nu1 subunit (DNA packaging protein)